MSERTSKMSLNLLERHSAALFSNLIKACFQVVDPQNAKFALLRRHYEYVVHRRAHRRAQHRLVCGTNKTFLLV